MAHSHLIDERAAGGFRARFGALAARSSGIDVAVTRVRLSLVDFQPDELGVLHVMRVLLAEVNSIRMVAEVEAAFGDTARISALLLLKSLLDVGKIQVRSAPLGGWAPDFSVFRDHEGPFATLVGVHSFLRPSPFPGPLFVSEHGVDSAAKAGSRFQEIWERSHDVGDAIRDMLAGVGGAGGLPQPGRVLRAISRTP